MIVGLLPEAIVDRLLELLGMMLLRGDLVE
jgi:hypothetical protein